MHSRWTALVALAGGRGECHFEVIAVTRGGVVTLRAVLTGCDHELAVAELDDAAAWSLGWQVVSGLRAATS